MIQHLLNFLLAAIGMIALLFLFYLYIKQSIGGFGAVNSKKGSKLTLESLLSLEPRKRLYVVGYKGQRFLISTCMDKTELLATLETEPYEESLSEETEVNKDETALANLCLPLNPSAGFLERFKYSLKMVFSDRFTGSGRK